MGCRLIYKLINWEFEQVLKNLLSNAFKFTASKGSITLKFFKKTEKASELLLMSVSDNGIGIAPAQQLGIFEAFQQADGATNRKYGGTGLGLSISKELVRILGGNIQLESEIGKGSLFTVAIPLFKVVANESHEKYGTLKNRVSGEPEKIVSQS